VTVVPRPSALDALVYQAEAEAVEPDVGRFSRFVEVESFVDGVLTDLRWRDGLESRWSLTPPLEVVLLRRSRSATFSAAEHHRPVIHLRDGSWDRLTILHELAHLAALDPEHHGALFCGVELDLVRWFIGFQAYGALRTRFDELGVRYREPVTG
jgi:putative metallohydrolase (TIGR04338 family)